MQTAYQQCTKCILDTKDDPAISFDEHGVCNYCHFYEVEEKLHVKSGEEGKKKIQEIVEQIKKQGKGKPYDCICGVSGGVDSTYLALQAKKLGLRVLCVHFDNGWNSELAVKNVENIVHKLNFDLFTYVINWEEFKHLQLAYLKASVIDIEAITDHAIIATLYQIAADKKINYILSGSNVVTESILPKSWIFNKLDHENILDIHSQFSAIPLKTYPLLTSYKKQWYQKVLNIQSVALLNYLPYNKQQVKKAIIEELNWKDYGGKHYESIWTRFYQGYILPVKFGVDKRKAHLSNLICSKQITREEALSELKNDSYATEQLKIDKEFVLKKLNLTEEEFETLMKLPVRKHSDFKTERGFFDSYPALRPFKIINTLVKKFS